LKAFLLAAGVGSRLGEITADTPKCLVPINGKPLLDYWFDSFKLAGIDEILINLHYLPEKVIAHLKQLPNNFQVKPFYEETLLGSAGTIRKAWDFVGKDESFYIVYADNFAEVNLRKLYEFHIAKQNPVLTLLAYPTDEPQRCGILELDKNDKVISFEEKPKFPRSNFANAGIHVASRELIDFIPEKLPADLGFHVLPNLVGKMYGYVTDEYIQDIGTPEAYFSVNKRLANQIK
jgi:mannose-1-phosphate guanylyltransferase